MRGILELTGVWFSAPVPFVPDGLPVVVESYATRCVESYAPVLVESYRPVLVEA